MTHKDPDARIGSHEVREICGGISDMTLYRWLRDPNTRFPRPAVIGRRRYWRRGDIIAWFAQAELAA